MEGDGVGEAEGRGSTGEEEEAAATGVGDGERGEEAAADVASLPFVSAPAVVSPSICSALCGRIWRRLGGDKDRGAK